MAKLVKYLKPYILQILALFVLVYVSVMTTLELPDYMARIINDGVVAGDNSVVLHTGILMLLVSLLGAAATVGIGFLASRIGTGFSRNVRNDVFTKVESFSMTEFNKFSTASLITRSTNDVQQIQMVLILILRMVLQAPIMGIGAIIKAYHTAPSMSWIIILAVVVMMGIIIVLFSIALPKFQLLQKLVDKLNLVTRQNLTGLRVIRAFNNEKVEQGKFESANIDLTKANLFVNRLMVIMQPVIMLIFNFTALLVIWVGAHLIGGGNLQIGDMMAFMQYAMQVIMAFLMVSIVFIMVPRAAVSAKRIAEVIETEPLIKDPMIAKRPVKPAGLVEFEGVTFSYPTAEEPALSNISFTAKPGETTAIIGSTGSGKSTLIDLIPRFYDVTEGQILIDGVDVRDYKLEDLYKNIGYVPQKSVLFSGTVESNIKYGHPRATDQEISSAAKTSQSEEFIKNLEDTYEHSIAQGGTNISGGQKQRLSFARAIIRDPKIYIFDDSFSALDYKTDRALRQALASLIKNKTVIIVAQRISTILDADKIIVLDEGKIIAEGSHQDLMKDCKVYREIAFSQLSEDELKAYQTSVDDRIVAAGASLAEGGL